ncbi:MAG TPA: serine hydrolase domain-containing protein, partial [Vicinamibacterales bacterium]
MTLARTAVHKWLVVLLLAAGIVAGAAQAPPPMPAGPVSAADVGALLKQFKVPGVSIAVIKDFKIEWALGYGLADADAVTPVTADTMFQAASISKTVAAMTSMRAVQDGRFGLDQDVNT